MNENARNTSENRVVASKNVSAPAEMTVETEKPDNTVISTTEHYNGNIVLWVQICICVVALAIIWGLRASGNEAYGKIRIVLRNEIDATGWYMGGEERNFLQFTQKSIASVREAAQAVLARIQGEPIGKNETRQATVHRKSATVPYGYSAKYYQPGIDICFPLANRRFVINSGYGGRVNPINGKMLEFHGGVDLAASTGDIVHAAWSGVVRFAGTHKSYGNYIRVIHPGGAETIYAHMQYLFVRSGQRVSAGDAIGTVGQTGAATGPHLHFEIIYKGVRYDPTEALEAAS